MEPEPDERRGRFSFSLRAKIILAFVALCALLSAAFGAFTYRSLNGSLFQELRSRVGNLTDVGSQLVDRAALRRLVDKVQPELSPEEVLAIERSADYQLVGRQLNRIRDSEQDLIRYVYTFIPTADENMALYVVDADVPAFLTAQEAGEPVDEEEISPFGSEFDITDFPVARQAIRERAKLVEEQYTFDEAFGVNSVTGYAPILDGDGTTMLAVLGLDMVDTDARATLQKSTTGSLIVTIVSLAVALVTSILLGAYLTRGIISLDRVVRSFSEKNMTVRARVKSTDEVGRLGRSFNAMAEIIQRYSERLESLLKAYGRFVPHDFLRFLKKESIVEVQLGDQVQQEMTVLFSDIRNFTALSEKMTPKENFNFINSFLSRIGPEIRRNQGFIDKYIGDAIMALFPRHPDDAVRAALDMRIRLAEYNQHRANSRYDPVEIGIGIHTGALMLGTIGEQERMDGSVIADAVNLASRLQNLTKEFGVKVLFSASVLGQLTDAKLYQYRNLGQVPVPGKRGVMSIYELFQADSEADLERKQRTRAHFERAVTLYQEMKIDEAIKLFEAIARVHPQDSAAQYYLRLCRRRQRILGA